MRTHEIQQTSAPLNAGFTLIEILVATSVASLIILMLSMAYRSTLESIKSVTGQAEYSEQVAMALNTLNRDLSNTLVSKDNLKASFVGDEVAGNSRVFFVSVNRVDFSAAGNLKKPFLRSDVRQTGYYLRENRKKPRTFVLIRREKNHYDDDFETGGMEDVILEDIAGLKIHFRQGNDWTEKWDSRETKRIPDLVRTTLTLFHGRGNKEDYIIFSYITMSR